MVETIPMAISIHSVMREKLARSMTIDISSDLNYEDNRKRTFDENNWTNHYISSDALAKSGCYFYGHPDTVKCQFCFIKLSQFEPADDPIEEHLKYSPNCPLIRRRNTANVPISSDELDSVLPPASYDECGTSFAHRYSLELLKNW